MRQATCKKEHLIKMKLKKEDPVELPMNNDFYELMHNRIMQAVDSMELAKPLKAQTKWSQSRIFLERNQKSSQLVKKISKTEI